MTPEALKFYDFLAAHGHPLDSEINIDSRQFHRFKCPNGNRTDAAYKFFANGLASGYLHCWKCGISEAYCSKSKSSLSEQEWQAYIKHIETIKNQSNLETKQRYSDTAILAQAVFSVGDTEKATEHAYLRLKQVKNYGLRILATENQYTQKARCYMGTLLVPSYNANDELVNLERIYFSKYENKFQKRPLKGAQRSGAYYLIGAAPTPKLIYISEGYSTAATVHESTGYPTAVTFNCGNIPAVTKILRSKYPQSQLAIIADDDKWHDDPKLRHAGLKAAMQACSTVKGVTYFLPDFSILGLSEKKLTELKKTDANDLFVLLMAKGLNRAAALDKVRQQFKQTSPR